MKIASVSAWREDFELSRPYTITFRTVTHVSNMIVKLTGSNGLIGLGSGSPEVHVTGEEFSASEKILADLQWLVGRDTDDADLQAELLKRFQATPAARAALDIALHDLQAKSRGLPLAKLWGQMHDVLPTSITIGIKSTAETLHEAEEYLSRDFKIIKLKLGRNLAADIERTRALRKYVGQRMKIRVDLNQGYTPEQFAAYWPVVSECDIEFMEQPFKNSAVNFMRELRPEQKKLIAADESLLTPQDAAQLIDACGIFNIKLMKCGGPFAARQIAAIALQENIELMWGCMDESRISIAAALHTAFSCASTRYLDLDGHLDLGRDIVSAGFTIEGGLMRLNDAPGLGVTLV